MVRSKCNAAVDYYEDGRIDEEQTNIRNSILGDGIGVNDIDHRNGNDGVRNQKDAFNQMLPQRELEVNPVNDVVHDAEGDERGTPEAHQRTVNLEISWQTNDKDGTNQGADKADDQVNYGNEMMFVLGPGNFHSGVAGKRKSEAPEIAAPKIVNGVLGPTIERSVAEPRIDKLTPGCRKSTGDQEDENGGNKGAFFVEFFGLGLIAAGNGFVNTWNEDTRDRKNKQRFINVELDAVANEGAVFDFTEGTNGPAAKPGIEFGDDHRQEDKDGEGKNFFKNGLGFAPGKTLEAHLMMEEGSNKAKEAR